MSQDRVVLVQEEPRGPSQLLELLVNVDGAQRIPFPDNQQLRSDTENVVVIKAVRLITNDTLIGGILNQAVTAPQSELIKIALVIYCEGWEKAQYLPVNTLNDMSLSGGANPHRYQGTKFNNWMNVDWTKSFLQYVNGSSSLGAGTPYVVMFDIEYVKMGVINNPDGSKSYFERVGPS